MPAVAVVLNAAIMLQRRGATRAVPARDFFQGLYQTARADDELITQVIIPAAQPDEVFGFAELSRRHGDFATVGVAVRARKSMAKTTAKTTRGLGQLEVVIFGSEPTPLLSRSAAGLALDVGLSDAAWSDIAHGIAADMTPIDNQQGRGETKRRQAAVLLRRVLQDMARRAAHG
jgi:aerobic carbon-monoxide dehydrogenase medium subunit